MRLATRQRSVSISGLDGCGKTSLIQEVASEMRARGELPHVVWLRFRHLRVIPLLVIARLTGLSERCEVRRGMFLSIHKFWRWPTFSRLYVWLTYHDTRAAVRREFRRRGPTIIVMDRFVIDTLVDLMISVGDHNLSTAEIGRRFARLVRPGHVSIMLSARAQTLIARRPENEADPNFELRQSLYARVAEEWGATILDAEESIDVLAPQVLALVCPGQGG